MKDTDCASILIDIDSVILEISSESMFLNIVSAMQVPPDPRSRWGTKGKAPLVCHGRSPLVNHRRSLFTDQI